MINSTDAETLDDYVGRRQGATALVGVDGTFNLLKKSGLVESSTDVLAFAQNGQLSSLEKRRR